MLFGALNIPACSLTTDLFLNHSVLLPVYTTVCVKHIMYHLQYIILYSNIFRLAPDLRQRGAPIK